MITQPMSVYPNNNAIDGTLNNTFEMEIKTSGDTVVGYQLQITKVNSNTIVYNGFGTNTILIDPIYNGEFLRINVPANTFTNGEDYNWCTKLYSPSATMPVANGVTQSGSTTTSIKLRQHNGIEKYMQLKIGSEIREISSYDSSTGIAVVSSAFSSAPAAGVAYNIITSFIKTMTYSFKGRATPVVNITAPNNDGEIIKSFSYNFIGNYEQSNNVLMKYFIFNIYNAKGELVNSSGQVYSKKIAYYVEELSNDVAINPYTVELIVNNQDDITIKTSKTFSIQYVPLEFQFPPTIRYDEDISAAIIEWQQQLQSFGIVNGAVTYEKNAYNDFHSVVLDNDTSITYNAINNKEMNLSEKSTILLSTVLDSDKQGKIIEVTLSNGDLIYITLEGFVFYINRKSNNKLLKKEIYNIFETDLSCFQANNTVLPNAGYYLYSNEIWPADSEGKYYIINGSDALTTKHFKISIIPGNITNRGYETGIYFDEVSDLDTLGD